jgi:hypothetical protein
LTQEVVRALGLAPSATAAQGAPVEGTYALDRVRAVVADGSITETETDPLTGAEVERRYPLSTDAPLMSWRSDFPRPGVARIGWVALPRT